MGRFNFQKPGCCIILYTLRSQDEVMQREGDGKYISFVVRWHVGRYLGTGILPVGQKLLRVKISKVKRLDRLLCRDGPVGRSCYVRYLTSLCAGLENHRKMRELQTWKQRLLSHVSYPKYINVLPTNVVIS